jgi:ATP-dependent Clp protease ATP-binding subunit ClpB
LPPQAPGRREGSDREIIGELRKFFRPEFLNRIDEIVRFDPLSREDLHRIVDIQLGRVEKTLAERKLTITLSPEARDYLARIGYDPDFGARPLKRAIQRAVLDPLAAELLKGVLKPGDRIQISLDEKGTGMVFRKAV